MRCQRCSLYDCLNHITHWVDTAINGKKNALWIANTFLIFLVSKFPIFHGKKCKINSYSSRYVRPHEIIFSKNKTPLSLTLTEGVNINAQKLYKWSLKKEEDTPTITHKCMRILLVVRNLISATNATWNVLSIHSTRLCCFFYLHSL